MTTTEIRADIHESIDHLDEHFLRAVHAMIITYISKESIVGYELDGRPITQQDLERKLEISEQQIKEGKYVSAKDLRKEMVR